MLICVHVQMVLKKKKFHLNASFCLVHLLFPNTFCLKLLLSKYYSIFLCISIYDCSKWTCKYLFLLNKQMVLFLNKYISLKVKQWPTFKKNVLICKHYLIKQNRSVFYWWAILSVWNRKSMWWKFHYTLIYLRRFSKK